MRDLGHEWTERRIREIEKRIRESYEEAIDDIEEKMRRYIAGFVARDAELRVQLKAGKITKADYQMWLNGQVFQRKRWQATLDDLTDTLARANQIAMQIVNEETPEVFAYNANWASYNFEKEMDKRGHNLNVIRRPGGVEPEDKKEPPTDGARVQFGWGLYSADAVKILLRDEPTLLPPSRVDIPKDKQWNMKNIARQIMQGIVQGEGVEAVAARLRTVAEMNIDSARTHARTAMTAAQNAGRLDQMRRQIELAEKFGEKVQKKWKSAKDSRVRKSHGILDGQIRDPDEPFEVNGKEIMYPGDPEAAPELVYNCRCTMSAYYPDSPPKNAKMRDDDPARVPIESMTFKEWMEYKSGGLY
jgi:predicted Holliday junction resolvase-like endonuclease